MRFNQNQNHDDDNYSDGNPNSDSESEDEDEIKGKRGRYQIQQEDEEEDAEGESEDGFRSQPANIPMSATEPKYGNSLRSGQVDGIYTTVPLDLSRPVPAPESPLTDLSPSSAGSHISAIADPNASYFSHKVHHPPAQYIEYHPQQQHQHQHQASTKSSYSSLSAVSNAVGIRKRNISDSSTSSNLRSISGSSTSSFPPNPEYHNQNQEKGKRSKESFSRSRSRVEEVLSDHSTPSSWVSGHGPNEGFHIGADPRFMVQIPHQHQVAPPPYEIEPYLMAPDAWTNGGYGWPSTPAPMPMARSVGGGLREGFVMPTEYDFTFNQGHGRGYGDRRNVGR
jgi:hypothetical protein